MDRHCVKERKIIDTEVEEKGKKERKKERKQ